MSRTLVILLSYLICHLHAHESPSHSIDVLTEHIEEDPTPALYFQRAMAHKALGKIDQAAADLTIAIKHKPDQLPWLVEHSRVELLRNQPNLALRKANQSLKLAKDNAERAEIHILRAQAYQLSGKAKPSLHACQLAFRQIPDGKIDWFILRSENQYILKLHKQRINGLNAGLKIYPDSILKSHYVDALIDAGQHNDALKIIKKELPTLRWRSHWQIKEARTLLALDQEEAAQSSLQAALLEIQQRLNSSQPDVLLLADRAYIEFLMGEHEKAKATRLQLRKHRAPTWLITRVETRTSKK